MRAIALVFRSLLLTGSAALLTACALLGDAGKTTAPAAPDGAGKATAAAPASPLTPGASANTTASGTPVPGAPAAPLAPVAPAAPVAFSAAAASSPSGLRPAVMPAVAPGAPPTFASIIKDARRIDGPLVLWQKEDKVWIEIQPTQFEQPFLLSPKIKSGIGEAFVLGGLMAMPINGAGGPQVVEFVRIHNSVRLQARNLEVTAKAGTPEARAVAASYAASLLGSTPVASQPHPERKSILIEANGLFLSDMLGVSIMLQRGLRQGYGLDTRNSVITAVRGSPQATVIETLNHYFTGNPSAPGQFLMPGAPTPQLPSYVPDTRSLLIGHHYSLAPLPDKPMLTRAADPRLGLFSTTVLDFSEDLRLGPRQRFVNRWRLERGEVVAGGASGAAGSAELFKPVKPITFWIDRNVPLAYRETVRSAILEWNKAFEKIGFQGAIVAEQQPDDAAFDTLDFGYASVRWMMNAEPAFGAIGPSHVDPRTGEILDADIAFEGLSARSVRGIKTQVLSSGAAAAASAEQAHWARLLGLPATADASAQTMSGGHHGHTWCQHAALGVEQLGYALDVMEARGELEPDSPVAQQFVQDYIKDSIMHEVGHTLGLRHNFRASRVYTEAQLSDAEFTRANGTTGSVMEYNPVNLARPGQSAGVPFQTTLGPYDYWAIEYAYKAMPAGSTAASERAELLKIAARSNEPLLAYGTDEDNFFGLDPETLQLDLGADPIAFASKRLDIARDLFKRQETRALSPERDYAVLRRSIAYALNDAARAVGVLARQIGGVRTLRDFPGSGRDPLQPVPAAVQRQALALISQSVLGADGLSLSPALQRRLAPDFLDRGDGIAPGTEFALAQRLLGLQSAVLGYLMSDTIAARLLDGVGKFDRPSDAFALSELYGRLADDIWSELAANTAIAAPRRELQRLHANRLAVAVLLPMTSPRVDARGLLRVQARALLQRIEAQQRRGAAGKESSKENYKDSETQAHLADSAETLRLALAAPLTRLGL
jgi:hypothetical protein